MRKFISLLLILALTLTIAIPVLEVSDSVNGNEEKFIASMLDEPYYTTHSPFVFTDYADYVNIPDFLTEGIAYVPGYLYAKNYETGATSLLLSENVTDFAGLHNRIYCLIGGSRIAYLDLDTFQLTEILDWPSATLYRMLVAADFIYFADDETIYRMNIEGEQLEEVLKWDGLITYYPISNQRISLIGDNSNCVIYNLTTGEQEMLENYAPVMAELAMVESDDCANNPARIKLEPNTSVSLPLSQYPVGSYFNDFGNKPCTCHSSSRSCKIDGSCDCKFYGTGIQCLGFAQYVFDVYSNCTSRPIWNSPGAHLIVDDYAGGVKYATPEQLRSYPVGTYLRVGWNPNIPSEHSFVIMKNNGSSVTIYECNIGTNCIIGTQTFSYATFCNTYYLYDVIKHSFITPVYYNETYHKYACGIPGCTGYILERHSGSGCTECVKSGVIG